MAEKKRLHFHIYKVGLFYKNVSIAPLFLDRSTSLKKYARSKAL